LIGECKNVANRKRSGNLSKTLSKAAEKMDIPVSAVIKTARISIDGNRQMVLEGHEGLLEYGDERIRINCRNLVVTVEGQGLLIRAMSPDGISLAGEIEKIEFHV